MKYVVEALEYSAEKIFGMNECLLISMEIKTVFLFSFNNPGMFDIGITQEVACMHILLVFGINVQKL